MRKSNGKINDGRRKIEIRSFREWHSHKPFSESEVVVVVVVEFIALDLLMFCKGSIAVVFWFFKHLVFFFCSIFVKLQT